MSEEKSKSEVLRDKVVDLVKSFSITEGGISQDDIRKSLAAAHAALGAIPFTFLSSLES